MDTRPITRERVLAYLKETASRPLKVRELAKQMRVPDGEYRSFRRLVQELERDGSIVKLRNSRYAPVADRNLITGRLSVTSAGFGFVAAEGSEVEVFIPATSLGPAYHTDRVMVRVTNRGGTRAQPEGEITKVLQRGLTELVGTFHRKGRFCYVEPDDARFGSVIKVPPGLTEDAEHGEIVAVRIDNWDTPHSPPEGRVSERLGDRDDPQVDAKAVMLAHQLPREFPPHVATAAEQIATEIPQKEIQHRRDIRQTLTFTIDPATARDFDDALSLETIEGGLFRVGIHIADVGHYVREGDPIDHEALARGTSVYLVDSVVPMLPERLSNEICSLRPNEDRLAFSVFVDLDGQAEVRQVEMTSTVINSDGRLSYEQAQEAIEGLADFGDLGQAIRTLEDLRQNLTRRRLEDGAIDFDLPEPEFELNETATPVAIRERSRLNSHRLIEEYMLLANRLVAEHLTTSDTPSLYRVHGGPDPESLEAFREVAAAFGVRIPAKGFGTGKSITDFLRSVQDKRIATVLNERLLRSMKKAEYTPRNIGHFGLAFRDYTHFTSPIRRYPDLVTHRILRERLTGTMTPGRADVLAERLPPIGQQSSERERVAQQAEWDSIKIKQARYLAEHLGESFAGTIVGVRAMGFFVRLDDILADGLIHVRTLGDDYYVYDEHQATLTGERTGRSFRLGDRVDVEVARADWKQKQIDLLLDEEPAPRAGAGKRRRGSQRGRRGRGRPR
ncbi:MAG: ribonuclease R [Gemmatimonadetes bacterium]|nr:ribonuclease R [Gemmatimonadota bacterium]